MSTMLLLSACADQGQVSSFPTGTFVNKPPHEQEVKLIFSKDGTFELIEGNQTTTTGTYYIEDDVIIYGLDTHCLEIEGVGSFAYYWFYEDGKLTFEPIGEDDCEGRSWSTGVIWTVTP
jgi:hypothetical protein